MTNELLITEPPLDAESGLECGVEPTETQWVEVYHLCRLCESGIPLETFLADPWRILREQGQEGALNSIHSGYLPLLPAQARVGRRLREGGNR